MSGQKNVQKLVNEYLEYWGKIWSSSTLRSETSRLSAAVPFIDQVLNKNEKIAIALEQLNLKPYAEKTLLIRCKHFVDYSGITPNPFCSYLKQSQTKYRHAYKKETVEITYEQARSRIEGISEPAVKQAALFLLETGLRANELGKVTEGSVIGKGGKKRVVYSDKTPINTPSYRSLHYELKKIGLKPHTLRKLFATKLVENGFNGFELCRVMGWESINTATSYLQLKADEELKSRIKAIV